ncbi:nibrin [Chanos chanos]|uniref:Nibrin n=1 Tax=Chanos chanos TaxID=29144 RepID=A0A6J2W5D4_CHACN|nr:nibrin [Chanos chanos]
MWKLLPIESGGEPFYLFPGKEYVVGRKNCDILLSSDQSISRVHAHLTVSTQALTLKDSSKYGTFVNGDQLAGGAMRTLKSGDRVTFGVFNSKYRVEQECLVVCSSCVDSEGKASLSQSLLSLGGRLVSSWTQDCTHLVMPSVKVTIKTICALLCCRPIVKPEFFTEFSKALQQKQAPPKAESFYPEINEPSLNKDDVDLKARPERGSLFSGKEFVFLCSKQMKRLSQAVSFGGGRSQLLEEGSLPLSLLESPQTCVIDMITGSSQTLISASTRKWVDSIGQILYRKSLRFITESEIGLAAIYATNQTYCNPCSTMGPVTGKQEIRDATLSQNAAVDETTLPAASQNITAYVVNTEPSQGVRKMNASAVGVVAETPEKKPRQAVSTPISSTTTSDKPSICAAAEVFRPSENTSKVGSEQKESKVEEVHQTREEVQGDDSAKFRAPPSNGVTQKKSPQKQSSLTSFFQPLSKKRPRDDGASSNQSDAKFSRVDYEDERDEKKRAAQSVLSQSIDSRTPTTNNSTHTTARMSQIQSKTDRPNLGSSFDAGTTFSPSLGLGPGLDQSSSSSGTRQNQDAVCSDSGLSKKRKEPLPDLPTEAEQQEGSGDLDLSLEELESIMSADMDEPLESSANKKRCLDQEHSGAANRKQWPHQEDITTSKKKQKQDERESVTSQNKHLEKSKHRTASGEPYSARGGYSSANRKQHSQLEECSSANRNQRTQSVASVKEEEEEEVSFQTSKIQNSVSDAARPSPPSSVKQESNDSHAVSGSGNDSELPRRLLQVQFKSLTVSATPRRRPDPLQPQDPNVKNFKKFRKVPVPGSQGLPKIIGGCDLVAHNRSKSSEVEEWLRSAAEEEKQNDRDESLADDLFRYNPKPNKRR